MPDLRPNLLLLALLSCSCLLLAGCSDGGKVSNGPDGQSASGGGSLAYNGASNGSHSDSFSSDGSCDLVVSANLGSGKVTFSIADGTGDSSQASVSGPGQKSGTLTTHEGPAGTWTLKAERSGGFTGQYAVTADC